MRIAFVANFQFTTDTPYKSPLGGSQSALCYLAVELTRLGHAITIFNLLPGHNESDGVQIRHISEINVPGSLKSFDVVIVLNIACATKLGQAVGFDVPLVLWTQLLPASRKLDLGSALVRRQFYSTQARHFEVSRCCSKHFR